MAPAQPLLHHAPCTAQSWPAAPKAPSPTGYPLHTYIVENPFHPVVSSKISLTKVKPECLHTRADQQPADQQQQCRFTSRWRPTWRMFHACGVGGFSGLRLFRRAVARSPMCHLYARVSDNPAGQVHTAAETVLAGEMWSFDRLRSRTMTTRPLRLTLVCTCESRSALGQRSHQIQDK